MHGDLHGGGMTAYLLLERAFCDCEDEPTGEFCPFHADSEDGDD